MNKDDLFQRFETHVGANPAARQGDRDRLAMQMDEFLARGGSIQQIEHPTIAEIKTTFNNAGIVTTTENQQRSNRIKIAHNLSKDQAIESGRKTFFGIACIKCQQVERWTKTGACITCRPVDPDSKEKRTYERHKAAVKRLPTYIGKQCQYCGSNVRNTDSGQCVNAPSNGKSCKHAPTKQ
jgi:hypothetical protein